MTIFIDEIDKKLAVISRVLYHAPLILYKKISREK